MSSFLSGGANGLKPGPMLINPVEFDDSGSNVELEELAGRDWDFFFGDPFPRTCPVLPPPPPVAAATSSHSRSRSSASSLAPGKK